MPSVQTATRESLGFLPAAITGVALTALTLSGCSSSDDDGGGGGTPPAPPMDPVGGVFALTNRHDDSLQLRADGQAALPATTAGNEVISYARFADGSLEFVGSFPTGGIGENIRNSGANPLASQDPLIVSPDGSVLYAVNAGSDSVTAMAIDSEMNLTVINTISTEGAAEMQNPVSLTMRGDVLYVLNTGTFFDTGTTTELGFVPDGADPRRLREAAGIIGFSIAANGALSPLAGSEVTANTFAGGTSGGDLGANGGSIEFSEAGDALYVTERRTNNIVTVALDASMVPTGAGSNFVSSTNQPFGTDIAVTSGGTEVLLVSQGNDGTPSLSTLSSFLVGGGGDLTPASQSDGTQGDPLITGFTFGCWVETFLGANGVTYAYTANTPDGNLTGYLVDNAGALTRLEDPIAGQAFPNIPPTGDTGGAGVLDTEIAGDFLYQVVNVGDPADDDNNSRISVFQVDTGGSLTRLSAFDVENDLFVPRQFVGIAGF